jgi:hypothetical protein
MNKLSFFTILTCCVCLLCSCARQTGSYQAVPESSNDLAFLTISYKAGRDIINGPNAKAFTLTIRNSCTGQVDDVAITLDEGYTSTLENLSVHLGFPAGVKRLGRSSLKSEESVSFIFSHDVSNHRIVTNSKGKPFPIHNVPTNVALTARQGSGKWAFKETDIQ